MAYSSFTSMMMINRWAVAWVPCTRRFACEVLPLAMLYLPHWHTNIVHSFWTIFKSFLFCLLLFVVILNVGVNISSLCDRQKSPFMSNHEVSMLVPLKNLKENRYERRSVTALKVCVMAKPCVAFKHFFLHSWEPEMFPQFFQNCWSDWLYTTCLNPVSLLDTVKK